MSEIDLPNLKEKLWHGMRADLTSLVPWFANNDLLLCPTCCRPICFDEFSVERIIPKQALADDPSLVRSAISNNERSSTTLLCRKPLIIKDRPIPGHGCNSWKGKFYDSFLRELFRADFRTKHINSRHQVALFSAGYLALFRQFGYQIALIQSGLLMRAQFFHPNSFLKKIPVSCQMMLAGESWQDNSELEPDHWRNPFSIEVAGDSAFVVARNMSFQLPLSRDPTIPLARVLPYAPSKYKFRLDLTTAFS